VDTGSSGDALGGDGIGLRAGRSIEVGGQVCREERKKTTDEEILRERSVWDVPKIRTSDLITPQACARTRCPVSYYKCILIIRYRQGGEAIQGDLKPEG
jgi:hypothetical protein